ncbi:MAG: fibronectin type III domain-containing protein, partial [Bacteroidota bacterium]
AAGVYHVVVTNPDGQSSTLPYGFTAGDPFPPASVTNLAAANPTHSQLTLTWTAPGDDGNVGTASQYDIRYATSSINESNFLTATQVQGVPPPKSAGSAESFVVAGLSPSTTYYFALKTADEVPNWSP